MSQTLCFIRFIQTRSTDSASKHLLRSESSGVKPLPHRSAPHHLVKRLSIGIPVPLRRCGCICVCYLSVSLHTFICVFTSACLHVYGYIVCLYSNDLCVILRMSI